MKLVMNVFWNPKSRERKFKVLYNNDENVVLYNKYMIKMKIRLTNISIR